MQIQEKPKFDTPFEWIGGEANVKALVERFYDLMDLDASYSALRAVHAGPLDNARQKPFGFYAAGWAARSTTPNALATRCSKCAICPSKLAVAPSASKSATNG